MADVPSDKLLSWALGIATAIVGGVIALVAYLSRTIFGDVRAKVAEIGRNNDESNRAQLVKLDRISEQVSENRTYRATNDLRLGHAERDLADVRRIVDDHTGFLQELGFRKRDGPPRSGG